MKKLFFSILIATVIIIVSLIIINKKCDIKEESEIESSNTLLLSTSDFDREKDFFNQSLFSAYTITKLNRSILGVSSIDFNKDGFKDLVITGNRNISKIYILFYHGPWNFTYKHVFSFEHDIRGITAGDFDVDNDIDLIFSSVETVHINNTQYKINGTINLLKNDGNMNFTHNLISKRTTGKIKDEEGRINPRITSADYNNDGYLDLLVGDNSGKVELYLNDGKANFESDGVIYDFGSLSWGLVNADFDNDGDIDFIVSAHEKGDRTKGHLYFNNNYLIESNYTYIFNRKEVKNIVNVSFVPAIASLSSFDYDNDGDSDIIVSTPITLYVLINKGDSFQSLDIGYYKKNESSTDIEVLPMYKVGIACADFNNDGFTDFCLGSSDGYLRLFLNNYQG